MAAGRRSLPATGRSAPESACRSITGSTRRPIIRRTPRSALCLRSRSGREPAAGPRAAHRGIFPVGRRRTARARFRSRRRPAGATSRCRRTSRYIGHLYTADHNAFNASALAVLNVSRDSMAAYGYSPATRVFEAAGAGACIITDAWEGIAMFFEPGREILVGEKRSRSRRASRAADPERGATDRRRGAGPRTGRAHLRAARRACRKRGSAGGASAMTRAALDNGSGMAPRPLRIVILGLSITSSWGNGHATTYRGLMRALCRRGHEVLFLECDKPWYRAHRDMTGSPFGTVRLYERSRGIATALGRRNPRRRSRHHRLLCAGRDRRRTLGARGRDRDRRLL